MNASFNGTENTKNFTSLLLVIQEKFHLASSSYNAVWHFTSFLILPHSYVLKLCSCMHSFPLDSIYRQTREVILYVDYPAMSGVTMNHIHNKSSTSTTEMLDLVHTCRIFSRAYIGESADASESTRNTVHVLHDCIMLSMGMHLSSDLFKLAKYPENLLKSSKSSWTKFPGGKRNYAWDSGRICKACL